MPEKKTSSPGLKFTAALSDFVSGTAENIGKDIEPPQIRYSPIKPDFSPVEAMEAGEKDDVDALRIIIGGLIHDLPQDVRESIPGLSWGREDKYSFFLEKLVSIHKCGAAAFLLGVGLIYKSGDKARNRGVHLILQAADFAFAVPSKVHGLALLLHANNLLEKSDPDAKRAAEPFLNQAAELEYAPAFLPLANLYSAGDWAGTNYTWAFKWLFLAKTYASSDNKSSIDYDIQSLLNKKGIDKSAHHDKAQTLAAKQIKDWKARNLKAADSKTT